MAIIYSYPTVTPVATDLVLGTDVSVKGKPTKNFTVQSIIDLVTTATGDLQFVLDLGNVAINKDINLTSNAFRGGSFITAGGVSIDGQVGTGFTDFTSTRITGTIQATSAAQPNITSLGTLTSLTVNSTVAGTAIVGSATGPATIPSVVGGSSTKLATEEAIFDYIGTNPPGAESLAATLAIGETTGGTDIVVSAGDDITFTDTSKILMGTAVADVLEIYNDSLNSYIIDKSPGTLRLQASTFSVMNEGATQTSISSNPTTGVTLYYNNGAKFETLTGGAKVTGAFEATTSGTFASLVNAGTYTAGNGVGAAGQILKSGGVGAATTWATEVPLYTWTIEADGGDSAWAVASGTTIDFTGVGNITTEWDLGDKELKISTSSPGGTGANTQVAYWTAASTLDGNAGLTYVAGGGLTCTGEIQGDGLSDGTFSGADGTYTGGVSITSTAFVGALTGNASTATQLASAGAITTTGDVGLTGGPYNYTQGGNMALATTIADTIVTGKILTSLSTATAQTITAADTILEAFGYLQATITGLPSGLDYIGTWDPGSNATAGGTPDLRTGGLQVPGHYYICSANGIGTPNGDGTTPNEWKIGDWVMRADATINEWQKIDNTSTIDGTGTANKIAKWTGTQTLGTGLIEDDGATVTIGTNGNLIVEGNTTLGNANTDTATVKGPAIFEESARFNVGISLGAATYGSAGQVLTSGGAAGTVNTWTTPTVGVVTSITGSTGITVAGTAAIPTVAITYAGASNAILAASAATPVAADTIWFNDADDSTIKKALISALPLDNYASWTLAGDTGSSQTISSTNTATFAGGFGISTVASATDTLTTAIDIVGTDNAIAGLTAATPLATDTLWFNDISDSNTIRKATIADIVDLGNETLAQVLGNGNTSGANDIVMADSQKVTFGTAPDLQLYHDTNNSYIETTSGSAGDLFIRAQGSGHDLYLRATDDIFIQPQGSENGIKVIGDGGVELYYDNSKKFETTSAGVTVTGSATATSASDDGFIVNSTDNASLRGLVIQSSGVDRAGMQLLPNTGEIKIGGYFGTNDEYPVIYSDGVASLTFGIGATPTATFANNVEIDGNLTVDGQIIHGGTHGGGGTYYKEYTTGTVAAGAATAFTLTRATSGTLMFSVYLTATLATNKQVAKMYQVAHTYGQTPVYNKIIDTGPLGADITVAFADSSNTAVICSIAAVTEDSQPVGITVIVGHGATAVTFA